MRHFAVVLCICAAACSGDPSRSPTSPSRANVGGAAGAQVNNGSQLPFKGTLDALETSQFQPPGTVLASDVGTGNSTHLGRFTFVSTFRIDVMTSTAVGTITMTSANGDTVVASFTGHGVTTAGVVAVVETATITGGTGRFAAAAGAFVLERSVVQATGITSGSFSGTIAFGH
jgi:hypothetical protein